MEGAPFKGGEGTADVPLLQAGARCGVPRRVASQTGPFHQRQQQQLRHNGVEALPLLGGHTPQSTLGKTATRSAVSYADPTLVAALCCSKAPP